MHRITIWHLCQWLVGLAALGGVCSHIAVAAESLVVKSREVVNPKFRDINATISITPLSNRAYSLKYVFDVPVDPLRGTDPTAVQFVTMCLAGHLSVKNGFPGWALGGTEAEQKRQYKNATEMEFHLAMVKEGETPEHVAGVEGVKWFGANFNANPTYRENCSRILSAEYMWK